MKIYWYRNQRNVVGRNVRRLRKEHDPPYNQKQLAAQLQLLGYEMDSLTVGRIERDKRFVADFEVMGLADALDVPMEELYRQVPRKTKTEKESET